MSSPATTSGAGIPRAHRVVAEEACLHLWLSDGERLIRWADCSVILATAPPDRRANFRITPSGCGIQWPELDEYLSVTRLMTHAAT